VVRKHLDDTKYKRGTLLVDHGNEDLVPHGVSALSVPDGAPWYVVLSDENVIFIRSDGVYFTNFCASESQVSNEV